METFKYIIEAPVYNERDSPSKDDGEDEIPIHGARSFWDHWTKQSKAGDLPKCPNREDIQELTREFKKLRRTRLWGRLARQLNALEFSKRENDKPKVGVVNRIQGKAT